MNSNFKVNIFFIFFIIVEIGLFFFDRSLQLGENSGLVFYLYSLIAGILFSIFGIIFTLLYYIKNMFERAKRIGINTLYVMVLTIIILLTSYLLT